MTSSLIKTAALILICATVTTNIQAQVKKSTVAKKKVFATKKVATASSLSASIAKGKTVYSNICVTCHMYDGLGVKGMNPPLAKTTYVLGDKGRLIDIILNGFSEDVEINGERYANTMSAHDYLKDDEIANVLTYVRNSFGNKASAVTAAEVKKARAKQ